MCMYISLIIFFSLAVARCAPDDGEKGDDDGGDRLGDGSTGSGE